MGVIRLVKSDYEMYEHIALQILVAIERDECKSMKAFYKKNKGKNPLPPDEIKGFPFINDEEFDSLKIDFDHPAKYKIRDLKKVKG